jgi:hypothetical protein
MLDTGVRVGEAVAFQWSDVHLKPAIGARQGYIRIRGGKSKEREAHIEPHDASG